MKILQRSREIICSAFIACVGLSALLLALAGPPPSAQAQSQTSPRSAYPPLDCPSMCATNGDTTAFPKILLSGETVTAQLVVKATCAGIVRPMHLAILIDIDDRMSRGDIVEIKKELAQFIRRLDLEANSTKIALVIASDPPRTIARLSDDKATLLAALKRIDYDAEQNLAAGINAARDVLSSYRVGCDKPDALNTMLVIASGIPSRECAPIARGSTKDTFERHPDDRYLCPEAMSRIALSPIRGRVLVRYFYSDIYGLRPARHLMERIRNESGNRITIKHFSVLEHLSEDVEYIPDSAIPPAQLSTDGRHLIWPRSTVLPKDGITLTYKVKPLSQGQTPISKGAEFYWMDTLNRPGNNRYEPSSVLVVGGRVEEER